MKAKKLTIKLDPRTKLMVLITIAVFVLGGAGGNRMLACKEALCTIPLVLLLFEHNWRLSIIYAGTYLTGILIQNALLPMTTGLPCFLLLFVTGMITKLLPGIMMGRYVIMTTKVSEFVAAMDRIHMTDKITIPFTVIFRLFPTIIEEYGSIRNAMRMRGISMGGGKPTKMLEYRVIPTMTCSVKIGEELSAAALTRGLGAPIKRTNICEIGFHFVDLIILFSCIVITGYWSIGLF